MKNNKGFGTKEVMVVIVLILVVMAILMYTTLGGASTQKLTAFRENASSFSKAMITNQNSFPNVETIYLGEAIHEGVMKDIKNTLGSGNCSQEASKVVFKDGHVYTTLKCGKYLIDNYEINDVSDIPIYEVSEWTEEKLTGDDVEEITLYNCKDSGKMVFDEYYEEYYFIFMVNDRYNESTRSLDGIRRKTSLDIVSKTFYRTKKLMEE